MNRVAVQVDGDIFFGGNVQIFVVALGRDNAFFVRVHGRVTALGRFAGLDKLDFGNPGVNGGLQGLPRRETDLGFLRFGFRDDFRVMDGTRPDTEPDCLLVAMVNPRQRHARVNALHVQDDVFKGLIVGDDLARGQALRDGRLNIVRERLDVAPIPHVEAEICGSVDILRVDDH